MIGREISDLRSRMGLTQVQFAAQFKVSPVTVSKWERGAMMPDEYRRAVMAQIKQRLDFIDQRQEAERRKQEFVRGLVGAAAVFGVAGLIAYAYDALKEPGDLQGSLFNSE